MRMSEPRISVPPNYLSFGEALGKAANTWFPDELAENFVSPEERQEIRRRSLRQEPPRGFLGETPEMFLAMSRRASLQKLLEERVWPRMQELLTERSLLARVINATGRVEEISPDFFRSAYCDLQELHSNTEIEFPILTDEKRDNPPHEVGLLIIRIAELENVLANRPAREVSLPNFKNSVQTENQRSDGNTSRLKKVSLPKNRGGVEQKFDWDAIWVEVARYIHYQGLPRTQNKLISHIQDWYENTAQLRDASGGADAPVTSTLKPKIKLLYDAVRRKDEN